MKISNLIVILESLKSENGDLEVSVLIDGSAYELDSEKIDIVEKEENDEKLLVIDVDNFFEEEEL